MTMQTTHSFSAQSADDWDFINPSGAGRPEFLGPGMVIGKLAEIKRATDGQFGPQIDFWWELYYTGENYPKDPKDVVPAGYNADGSVYRLRDRTSTKFGKGKVVAKARERAEALLKREISDDEDMGAVKADLPGKVAFLYLVENDRGYLDVKMVERYDPKRQVPPPYVPDGVDAAPAAGDDEVPF